MKTHKRRLFSNIGQCSARPVDGNLLVDEWHLVNCDGCLDDKAYAEASDNEVRREHVAAVSDWRKRKAR